MEAAKPAKRGQVEARIGYEESLKAATRNGHRGEDYMNLPPYKLFEWAHAEIDELWFAFLNESKERQMEEFGDCERLPQMIARRIGLIEQEREEIERVCRYPLRKRLRSILRDIYSRYQAWWACGDRP